MRFAAAIPRSARCWLNVPSAISEKPTGRLPHRHARSGPLNDICRTLAPLIASVSAEARRLMTVEPSGIAPS